MENEIYCHKCKKRTKNINAEIVQTANGRWRIAAKCLKCKTNKSKFIQDPNGEKEQVPVIEISNLLENEKLDFAKELHKPVRKKFQKRKILTLGKDDLWAADLIIMKQYENENNGFGYMLNIIDTFSKYVWSVPLKKKNGIVVSKAFKDVLENVKSHNHSTPKLLHTDKGLEFENRLLKELLDEYKIKMYHTESLEKSAIIERFNRTLNQKMKIRFEVNGNKNWIDILQELVNEYNKKDIHRSIGIRPAEVDAKNENEILRYLFKKSGKNGNGKKKFKIGNRVRITKSKKTFANKYEANWTKEIFEISEILETSPLTYKIKDLSGEEIQGAFYPEELQLTKF